MDFRFGQKIVFSGLCLAFSISTAGAQELAFNSALAGGAGAQNGQGENKENTETSSQSAEPLNLSDESGKWQKLSIIEKQFFKKEYPEECADKRLARLEIFVFGQIKKGVSEETRLNALDVAISDKSVTYVNGEKFLAAEIAVKPQSRAKKKETYLDFYNQAAADIRLKRYHAAADELLQCIRLNSRFPAAYAYMGDVLLKLQDVEGAKEAYKACFEVDPFGKYGRYGKAKLMGLAQQAAYSAAKPQDSPKVVERTIRHINNQAQDLAGRYQAEYHNSTSWRTSLMALAQRRAIEASRNARRSGGSGYLYGNDRNEVSDRLQINSYWAITDYNTRLYRARAEAVRKAALVAQSAADLKAQMLQPAAPGGTTLRALGTNLYVRYYGDENSSLAESAVPEDPPVELSAKAKKISLKGPSNRAR